MSNTDTDKIAASTVNGFYIVDKQGNINLYASAQEQYDIDMSAYITPMLFNTDGTVWLGTEGGGINLYDVNQRKILKCYKEEDGLPSNDIYTLVRDNDGGIWIGTGSGVALLKDSVVYSLNYLYGIDYEYNKSSGFLLSNGDVILGGTSGAVIFSPQGIVAVDSFSPLSIVSFTVDGVTDDEAMSWHQPYMMEYRMA